MKHPIVILGNGGFAKELFEWIQISPSYQFIGFFSDLPERDMFGQPTLNDLVELKFTQFVVGVGDPILRQLLFMRAQDAGLQPAMPIVHPRSYCGTETRLGRGVIICPNAILTSHVTVGDNTLVNIGATIGHDAIVGEHCNIAPGANISGGVKIDDLVYVGTNAAIREKRSIGSRSVIGMGTMVVKDVPSGVTLIGAGNRQLGVVGEQK